MARILNIPNEFRKEADAFPPLLQALLEAELAAGNQIAGVGHTFPAAPCGAYFILTGPITTRARASGDGLKFRDYNSLDYSGSFTDDRAFFFLLEPPLPQPPEPDMDAIRAAHAPHASTPELIESDPNTALGRFERSMVIDYEKWHDGIGYDLDALAAATPAERNTIENMILGHDTRDWRDVEALAALNTPRAQTALKAAMNSPDPEIRMAVTRHAPQLVPDDARTASLVKALQTAKLYGGLSQALGQAAEFHPKGVVEALFQGVLKRDGETAVHFAAMLMFVHGKANEPFDWNQHPFFLRFHTEDPAERKAAFLELCEKIEVQACESSPNPTN